MIVHVGESISILEKEIVAIIDVNTALESETTKDFVENLIKNNRVMNHVERNLKTYIITTNRNRLRGKANVEDYELYLSNISSTSILNRIYSKE